MGYMNAVDAAKKELNKQHDRLNKEQSRIDLELSDAYHDLERMEKIRPIAAYRHTKRLKTILDRRRVIKEEIRHLDAMRKSLKHHAEKAKEAHDQRLNIKKA
ncbi:hypothetical protein [Pontibacillus salipaludis]|uniref:Uncharacterized protein n=1 Tax=Pontibacillus salipaludis TaxID=1697394 RepID=A0ABQ1Q024_9BACI|nr:hypothetical protein [Pontibacillus salipaludis]GGD07827.1 hypothetical protein GCM10011389_14190 [Pontibacillus salipaludis]